MIWLAICRVRHTTSRKQAGRKSDIAKLEHTRKRLVLSQSPRTPQPPHQLQSKDSPPTGTPPHRCATYFVINLLAQEDNTLAVQPVVDVYPVRRRGTRHTVGHLGHSNRHHCPPGLGRGGRHDRRGSAANKRAAAASGRQGRRAHTGDAADKGSHSDGSWMEHTGAIGRMGGEGRKEEECVDAVRAERALGWKELIASRRQTASESQRAARDQYPAPLDGSGT